MSTEVHTDITDCSIVISINHISFIGEVLKCIQLVGKTSRLHLSTTIHFIFTKVK